MGADFRMYFIDINLFNFFQKHFDICPKFPVLCTNKCGARDIPREKVCFAEVLSRPQHLVC